MSNEKQENAHSKGIISDPESEMNDDQLSFGNKTFCHSKEGFDPNEISWVTERIGVTNFIGSRVAANLGHYVINTAEEIESKSDL